MAVIGKIRQRSGLLIFLIGLSIVGFLIMDATNSQGSLLKGRKDSVGKVNGEKIAYTEFSKKYEDNLNSFTEKIVRSLKRNNLKGVILSFNTFNEKSTDNYNKYCLMRDWFEEKLLVSNVSMCPTSTDVLNIVSKSDILCFSWVYKTADNTIYYIGFTDRTSGNIIYERYSKLTLFARVYSRLKNDFKIVIN